MACQARYACLLVSCSFLHQSSKDSVAKREHQGRGRPPQGLQPCGHCHSPSLPSFLLSPISEPFLSDFLTSLCLPGRNSSPRSLLPCLTAFLLPLPGSTYSVPLWLPPSPNSCRESSLQSSSGRAKGRQRRKSRAEWLEAPGQRASNLEHLGSEDLPPSLLASLRLSPLLGTRLQRLHCSDPTATPVCLVVLLATSPSSCDLTSHITSYVLPPLSCLVGLPFLFYHL